MFGSVVTRPKKGRKECVDDDGLREVGRVTWRQCFVLSLLLSMVSKALSYMIQSIA